METKEAYLTLLSTEDYLKGVLVLYKSLMATKTQYPFIVLLSQRINENTEKTLKSYNIQTLRIDKLLDFEIPNDVNSEETRWSYTFEKLHIFRLTQFEKLVFLDSDMLVLENIDELFQKKHLSAVSAGAKFPGNEHWFIELNSGLLVIEPNLNDYKGLVSLIPSVVSSKKDCGDQDVINEYVRGGKWTKELWLDDKYNMFQIYIDWYVNNMNYTLKKKSSSNIKIIHFIGRNKPWMRKINITNILKFRLKSLLVLILGSAKNKKYYRYSIYTYMKYLLEFKLLK